jgi:hypothetical protein
VHFSWNISVDAAMRRDKSKRFLLQKVARTLAAWWTPGTRRAPFIGKSFLDLFLQKRTAFLARFGRVASGPPVRPGDVE